MPLHNNMKSKNFRVFSRFIRSVTQKGVGKGGGAGYVVSNCTKKRTFKAFSGETNWYIVNDEKAACKKFCEDVTGENKLYDDANNFPLRQYKFA